MYNVVLLTGAIAETIHDAFRWELSDDVMVPSLGAYSCANALRNNNISCLVVNHVNHYSIEEINDLLDQAVCTETLLIGISTTFLNNSYTSDLSKTSIVDRMGAWAHGFDHRVLSRLRCKFPKLKFILGGFNVSASLEYRGPDFTLDFMSLGYSEVSIVQVVTHLISGTPIPNSYKNVFGTVVVDDREAASYDFANTVMHWLPEDVVNHTKLPIGIGRGCIFNCKFCSYPMRGKHNLDHVRTGSSIVSELQHNYKNYGIKKYTIIDDTFNDSREKLVSMRDAIKTLDFQPEFWAYIRLDLIATRIDTLDVLYDLGVRSMYLGIESLTKKTAMALGKGYSSEKQISTINFIKEKYPKITLWGSFIIGGPYESEEDVTETARMLRDKEIRLDGWRFIPLGIQKNPKTNWPSEFDLNWQKYGYTSLGEAGSFIIWQNDHMSRYRAFELQKIFHSEYMPADWVPFYHTKEWFIEDESGSTFLPKYKQQLLNIVRSKNTITTLESSLDDKALDC